MTQISFELSLDGLKGLQDYLDRIGRAIDDFPKQLMDDLTQVGEEYLMQMDARAMKDGNENTYTTRKRRRLGYAQAEGSIKYKGYQVAYVEFGTGMVGQGSPHPMANEAGYKYYVPSPYKDVRDGELGWWFQNQFKVGIPSQRPVYNTARYLRENLKSIAIKSWKKVF